MASRVLRGAATLRLVRHFSGDLDAVALALNTRPRKTLAWKTPAEALDELLLRSA
jgi:IS30 family transposase